VEQRHFVASQRHKKQSHFNPLLAFPENASLHGDNRLVVRPRPRNQLLDFVGFDALAQALLKAGRAGEKVVALPDHKSGTDKLV
jgi:hypothetical protein